MEAPKKREETSTAATGVAAILLRRIAIEVSDSDDSGSSEDWED